MNKEIILDLINALGTLKDIYQKQNEVYGFFFETQMGVQETFFLIQNEMSKKLTSTINDKDLTEKIKKISEQVKVNRDEARLKNKELQDKLIDFDYILNEIKGSLD